MSQSTMESRESGLPSTVGAGYPASMQPQPMPLAPGGEWVHFETDGVMSLCRPELEESLRSIYSRHAWVYDAIASAPGAVVFRGRKPVVAGAVGESRLVVKRMHHGGLLAPIGRDFFLTSRRARSHVVLADYLTAHGVATAPVAFASWRRIRGLMRCEVGFELIEGAIDADRYFFGGEALPDGWESRAAAIGAMVGRLHQISFLHADLNLMNFLFSGAGHVYILDLDKTPIPNQALTVQQMTDNLARLERSVRKQGRNRSVASVESLATTIHAAYQRTLIHAAGPR